MLRQSICSMQTYGPRWVQFRNSPVEGAGLTWQEEGLKLQCHALKLVLSSFFPLWNDFHHHSNLEIKIIDSNKKC